MNFDLVLADIGEAGRWQLFVSALLWIPAFFSGVHVLMLSFTGLEPTNGYRCRIPGCDSDNFQFSDVPADIFPSENGKIDYCRYRNFSKTESDTCLFNAPDYLSCNAGDEYAYAPFEFKDTLITEFGLVCDKQGLTAWIGSAYMFGLMVGSYICGTLADKYGRKVSLMFAITVSSVGSLVGAFMPEYYSYLASRFLTAVGAQGIFLNPFSTTVEIFGSQKNLPLPWRVAYKTMAGVMVQVPFALGEAAFSLVAQYIKHWRTLQWTVSVLTFSQLFLWFVVPESPRWLLAVNKTEQAKRVIETAARWNGHKDYVFKPENYQVKDEFKVGSENGGVSPDRKYGIKDLFHPSLRRISITLMICWPIVTLGYYGITFSMASLNDDLFVSFILSSLVEVPAYLVVFLFMDTWGRKPLFSLSLLISGLVCILCGVLEPGALRTTLAMVGKFCASSSFALVYMYTAELLPTTIRSSGVGICSLMARIGGISAPQIALSLPKVAGVGAPFFVMGACSVFGGFLSLLLPETLGSNLPETIEDIDVIKLNSKPIWKCANFEKTDNK